MKRKYVYITDSEFFDDGALKNPISVCDRDLEKTFPQFDRIHYNPRIIAADPPTEIERSFPAYNSYRDRYGQSDISAIDRAIAESDGKHIFLNSFDQALFDYTAPLIRETASVLYLFKCPRIHDLSALSQFSELECLFIYWNNKLETLWDMTNNPKLKVLSFHSVTKLCHIEQLIDSSVEHIHFDSLDNSGNRKEMLFDDSVFAGMKNLKHLCLIYKKKKAPPKEAMHENP